MKTEYRANQALQDQSAQEEITRTLNMRRAAPASWSREQARAEWGGAQGRYPVKGGGLFPPEYVPPDWRDSLWFWSVTLVPILMVSAFALVAFLEPGWLVALAEYIK